MKLLNILLTSLLFLSPANAQPKVQGTSYKTIKKIFDSYKTNVDGIDSRENKDAMTKALLSLQNTVTDKELLLLVDVWLYYDPTDFRTRELEMPVFLRNKPAALKAVRTRIKNKRKWESADEAPYSELSGLERELR